ncbi:MAG: hypothetical protein H7Z37_14850 [Pyrinomonadaceae bacterium]|nr:hypothetical protein [Pyrinomonadaceae bacterium]
MQVTTIQGIVKNGQIILSEDVKLPEAATVYVVVPNLQRKTARIMSPRLANKADANRFVKTIEEDVDDEV